MAKNKMDELKDEQRSDAEGIKANVRNAAAAREYLKNPTASIPVVAPVAATPSRTDLINPNARYGSRPGEVRLDSEGNAMPKVALPSYDDGGDVPEDQIAAVHAGEKVLDPTEAEQYRAAVGQPELIPTERTEAVPSEKAAARVKVDDEHAGVQPVRSTDYSGQLIPEQSAEPTTEKSEQPTLGKGLASRWLKKLGASDEEAGITTPKEFTQGSQFGGSMEQGAVAPKELQRTTPGMPQVKTPASSVVPSETLALIPGTPENRAAKMPIYGGPGKPVAQGELIPTSQLGKDEKQYGQQQFKAKIAEYDKQYQTLMDKAATTNDPDYAEQAARVKEAKLTYEKAHPWGAAESARPGVLGKLGHVAEMIASRSPFGISTIAATVPGSEGARYREMVGAQEQAKESSAQSVAETKPVKEGTPEQQLIPAKAELRAAQASGDQARIKAAQGKVDDITATIRVGKNEPREADLKQQYKEAEDTYDKAQKAGDQAGMNAAKQTMDNISKAYAMGLVKPETQEKNKLDYQATVAKVSKTGLPVDPDKFNKSLDTAVKRGTITADEAANARAYQLANPSPVTNIQVSGAEAQTKANLAKANKYYSYVDDSGNVQVATGDKVPPAYEADATPIKDLQVYMNEAETGNIVQQSLNRIHEDVDKHPEVFDNASARNIIATTTEQIDRQAAGMLIAGTGGTIPLPSGMGDMINTALQNNALDKKTSAAVKQYIADYKAMKDKAMVLQMELQNGKIGRGNAQAFKSITDQIPGGNTPDSKTARRQMDNLQQVQDDVMRRYPNERGGYKKEKPYQYAGTAPTGATDEVVKDGKVIGHVVVENGKKKFKAVE